MEEDIWEIDEAGYCCNYCGLGNTILMEGKNMAYCGQCGMVYKVLFPNGYPK